MEKVELLEVVKVTEEVESAHKKMETTIPKKRKNKASEEHIERPKKPRSAYLLYYFDVHQVMQLGTPNMPQSEVNKRISESWKRLSVAEKSYYLERAKLEKEGVDTSSLNPCKHLPGFRKILPRASCFLLPKGSSSNHHAGGSQSLVSIGSLDISVEGGLPSVSLTQESQFTPLGFAGEVELSEHHFAADDVAQDTEAMSPSMAIQGNTASSLPKTTVSTDASFSQGSTDFTVNGFTVKRNEAKVASSCYNGAVVQQTQGEATQVMTIVPTQNLLEPKSLAGVGSLRPVMMISLGAKGEQSSKPSYKMSVKTYTRRGRGRCLNPGCSFMYVTRHKPPTCPECGSHLGGKWIPPAQRMLEKEAAPKEPPQTAETGLNVSSQSAQPPVQEENADVQKTNTGGSYKDRQKQRSSKKKSAAAAGIPPEGGTKPQAQARKVKDNPKSAMTHTHNWSSGAVQKRPVRPILPALYNTGGALIQILTVPPDKGKCQGSSDTKPPSVPRESFPGLKPSTLKQLGQAVPTTTATQVDAYV